MPTGIYKRRTRVIKHTIICIVCGSAREYSPGELRQRTGKYCSKLCSTTDKKLNDRYLCLTCDHCSKQFKKRKDHLTKTNFCSKECSSLFRRIDGAKWRDSDYIKNYMKAYNAAHLDKRRISQKKYRENNKNSRHINQQTRRTAGRVNIKFIQNIFDRAKSCCVYCGKLHSKLEIDHIEPISAGGSHTEDNLIPCCRSCNASKGTKPIEDWVHDKHGKEGLLRTVLFMEKGKISASTGLIEVLET